MKEHLEAVIFRKWRRAPHSVLAIFPAQAGTNNPSTCGAYEHVGQHGSCDPQHCIAATLPATDAEAAELRRELEGAPYHYRLKVYRRLQRSFYYTRREQVT